MSEKEKLISEDLDEDTNNEVNNAENVQIDDKKQNVITIPVSVHANEKGQQDERTQHDETNKTKDSDANEQAQNKISRHQQNETKQFKQNETHLKLNEKQLHNFEGDNVIDDRKAINVSISIDEVLDNVTKPDWVDDNNISIKLDSNREINALENIIVFPSSSKGLKPTEKDAAWIGENSSILSEGDCKSDSEILEEGKNNLNEGVDDYEECKVAIASTSNSATISQKPKHRRILRSKSWSARTRNDSLNAVDIRLIRERLLRTQTRPQPGAFRNFTYQQKMTLVSLALVDFMSFCSMSIMAPFFPREANEKGMSDSVSGFVFSFYALIMFITSPIFGKILPNVGAKFLLISGMFTAGFCNLLFGVLEYIVDYETFTTYCFILRGLEALGASAYSTASFVYVVNTFPNNIGSVLGILETFIGLGMSVGPAIGGLLYSIGGFGLPFYVLGVAMVVTIPINCCLLPAQNDYSVAQKSGSVLGLVKVPAVVITSIVIIVVSNIWAFLDPTLEPHLRQFDLDAHQVGLIFLLFSGLYGLSSPLWGWLADRINNHWCMMVWGLVFCSIGLLLLGPSPMLPFLKSSLWLNLVGLSIVGISVALTLLPTFQGVLTSSIEEGGCSENIATYSIVAGVWSCMYSLGEVIGPSLGGVLLKNYGFPVCSTVMAASTFVMAIITFTFFSLRPNKTSDGSESSGNDFVTDGAWHSNGTPNEDFEDENQPLLSSTESITNLRKQRQSYGGTGVSSEDVVDFENEEQSLNIQNVKNENSFKMHTLREKSPQSLLEYDQNHNHKLPNGDGLKTLIRSENYQKYLEESLVAVVNMENNFDSNRKGSNKSDKMTTPCDIFDDLTTDNIENDFVNYSLDKVKYYKQTRRIERDEPFNNNNELTDIRGTVNLTSKGACEV